MVPTINVPYLRINPRHFLPDVAAILDSLYAYLYIRIGWPQMIHLLPTLLRIIKTEEPGMLFLPQGDTGGLGTYVELNPAVSHIIELATHSSKVAVFELQKLIPTTNSSFLDAARTALASQCSVVPLTPAR